MKKKIKVGIGITCMTMSLIMNVVPCLASKGNAEIIDTNFDDEKQYSSGQYKVGTDIPAGEYIIFASGGTGYFCVSSDANGDDIIENDNFEYNSIISVSEGQYFELVRCTAIPIDEVKELDLSKDGMFKVGLHVPAGEYKLVANAGQSGYYCIYDSSVRNNIITNNNFEGNQYVTITDGQYLLLSRCKFETVPRMVITDKETVKTVQEKLNALGYDCGTPDGIAGAKTQEAIKKYKLDKQIGDDGNITQDFVDSLNEQSSSESNVEEPSSNIPDGLSLDEDEWSAWKSTNKCSMYSFARAAEKVEFTYTIPFGQEGNHKMCSFVFKDDDSTPELNQSTFYYGVENQDMFYVGLFTDDESVYNSADFKEACIRTMLAYNIHFDSDKKDSVLNLSRERAEEIVNYCFDNGIKHCLVDNMRIRLIRNDNNDNYYSFHMEY